MSPPHVSTGSHPSSGLRLLYIGLDQMDEKKKKHPEVPYFKLIL